MDTGKNISVKLILAVAALLLIGVFRVVLEVKLGIVLDGKWFSYDRDVLFVMACFPVYLCFFIFMCLHVILKACRVDNAGNKLIVFLFFIQFAHLLIPVLDYIGFKYDIPYNTAPYLNAQGMSSGFSLNPFSDLAHPYLLPVYFTPLILLFTGVTTFGINFTWLLVGVAFFLFLRKSLNVGAGKATGIILLIFQILYWPIYKYYFVFDWLFNKMTGVRSYTHYGYGAYFLILGLIGAVYFLAASREEGF
jgi:hypothetical protein